jgi:uncharacterized protein YciU (UPF0263 family)
MKVYNVDRGDNDWHFEVQATNEEVGNLINIAILSLMAIGLANEEDEIMEIDLANVPMERFYKV